MFKKIASDSLVYFLGAFFNQLSGFIVVVLLMRHVSVDLFGIYSYAAAIVMMFTVLADGGISQYVVKQINQGREAVPVLYRRFQGVQLLVSLVIMVLMLVTAIFFNSRREAVLICLLGAGALLSGYLTTAFSFFIAAGERWIIFGRDVVFGVSRLCLVSIGVYANLPLEYFCAIAIFAQVAILCYVMLVRRRRSLHYLLTFTLNFGALGKVAQEALPYTMLTLMNIVYNKIDVFMLKRLSTQFEVGYYAGATQFIYPFMFVSSAVMAAIFPMLTQHLGARKKFDSIHSLSTYILGGVGLMMSVSLFVLSPLFYEYFFGHKFDGSLPIYRILVWYLALVFFYGGYSNTIVARGGVRFLLGLNIIMILVNVVGNALVIPGYGARGAAMVTIGCEVLILLVLVAYYEFLMPNGRRGGRFLRKGA